MDSNPFEEEAPPPRPPKPEQRKSVGPSYLRNNSTTSESSAEPAEQRKSAGPSYLRHTTNFSAGETAATTTASASSAAAQKRKTMGPSYLRAQPAPAADEPPPVPKKDQAATADMLERRAKELEQRERELEERERRARKRETDALLASEGANDPRAPNWPPCLPKKFLYQDFEVDIPAEVRSRVKLTYYHTFGLLLLHFLSHAETATTATSHECVDETAQAVMLLYNMICGLAVMFAVDASALGDMVVACVLVLVLSALSFFSYRQLYKAARTGSTLAYGIFLCGMALEILLNAVGALGWPGSGFLGIVRAVQVMGKEKTVVGLMCLFNGIFWGLSAVFGTYMLIHVRVDFSRAGGLKAFKKQAAEKAVKGTVNFVKEHPDAAKKAGKAAYNYARENPEVFKEAAKGAASAAYETEASHILV